jgi:SH3-like domain-containing protein
VGYRQAAAFRRAWRSPARAILALLALTAGDSGGGIWPGAVARAASPEQPKFFSLKSNPVNLRKGPGIKYPKVWVFRREGLPVEVLREHGRWRQVRDSDGATGWILRTLISSRRTALVTPWQLKESGKAAKRLTALYSGARSGSRQVAMLEAGTLVSLKSCDGQWCRVSIGRFKGYVRQERLWGVYPREILN